MIKTRKGFTLVELLTVVTILGILATLVVPRYLSQNERGYVGEATSILSALRQAEMSYQLEFNAYTGTIGNLDASVPSGTKFNYSASTAGAVTATRSGGTYNAKTIILNADGTWDQSSANKHPYSPT